MIPKQKREVRTDIQILKDYLNQGYNKVSLPVITNKMGCGESGLFEARRFFAFFNGSTDIARVYVEPVAVFPYYAEINVLPVEKRDLPTNEIYHEFGVWINHPRPLEEVIKEYKGL